MKIKALPILRWNNTEFKPKPKNGTFVNCLNKTEGETNCTLGFCINKGKNDTNCFKNQTLHYNMDKILEKYVFFATHLSNFTETEKYIVKNYAKNLTVLQQKVMILGVNLLICLSDYG